MPFPLSSLPEQHCVHDVIVIGAGAAGMGVALCASAEGARVLLVESTPLLGGTSALSAGTTWVPGTRHAAEVGQADSIETAESFLSRAIGDRTAWGKGIKVAVLDTGVKDHPTFASGQVTHIDLVNDGKPMHSHGTSVASLIAGQDERVPGVAPGAEILDIRVANDKGYSVTSVLAQGILEAVNRGARIINISMGGYDDSAMLRQAVAYAQQKGAFIVAAAGNESYDQLAYPAAIEQVVSVASVDGQNKQAYFSNSGKNLDFAAPGVGLSTAWETNMVATASGTSQSAGVVSGIMAANLSLGVRAPDLLRQMQRDARATGAPTTQVGSGVARVTGRR